MNKWFFIHLKLYNYIFIGKYFLHLIIGFKIDSFTREMFFHNVDLYLYSVLHFKEKKKRIQTSRKHMIELGDYSWFFFGGGREGNSNWVDYGEGDSVKDAHGEG